MENVTSLFICAQLGPPFNNGLFISTSLSACEGGGGGMGGGGGGMGGGGKDIDPRPIVMFFLLAVLSIQAAYTYLHYSLYAVGQQAAARGADAR